MSQTEHDIIVLEVLVDIDRHKSLSDQQFMRQLLRREWVLVESGTGWFLGGRGEWSELAKL